MAFSFHSKGKTGAHKYAFQAGHHCHRFLESYFSLTTTHTHPSRSKQMWPQWPLSQKQNRKRKTVLHLHRCSRTAGQRETTSTCCLTPQKCLHIQNSEYIYSLASKYRCILLKCSESRNVVRVAHKLKLQMSSTTGKKQGSTWTGSC